MKNKNLKKQIKKALAKNFLKAKTNKKQEKKLNKHLLVGFKKGEYEGVSKCALCGSPIKLTKQGVMLCRNPKCEMS